MLEVRHLRFDYHSSPMVYDLTVASGSCTALIGPSGGGKSTLLNLIAGFEQPVGGDIIFDGLSLRDLPPQDRPVTMLFQEHNLFPHLTAAQNAGLGLHPGLKLSKAQERQVEETLDHVGLNGLGARLPAQLSGGQRQRVALARSLARNKPLLLLDEPFSALDPGRRKKMLTLVDQLRRDRGLTVIMASHAPEDAAIIADQIAYIEEGKIIQCGPPEQILGNQASESIRHYLGDTVGD